MLEYPAIPAASPSHPPGSIRGEALPETGNRLDSNRDRLEQLLLEITPAGGFCSAAVEGVKLDRTDRGVFRWSLTYDPRIYFLVSGRGIGQLGGERIVYEPGHYVVFATPTPLEFTNEAGQGKPALGISVPVDIGTLAELASALGLPEIEGFADPFDVNAGTPLDLEMSEAMLRLVSCLGSDTEAKVLGPNIIREIVYRTLRGPRGYVLRSLLKRNQHLARIHTALDWIHRHFAEPFNIPGIANQMCMSVSTFQHSFKQVTGVSPLQYVKSIRLHKARLLIRYQGVSASVASAVVGYESPSQFSREFKRFFGHKFTEDRDVQSSASSVTHRAGVPEASNPHPTRTDVPEPEPVPTQLPLA